MNGRCRTVLDVLSSANTTAQEEGCDIFAVLGDLFDNDHPIPQLLTATHDVFQRERSEMMVYLMKGNHDMRSSDLGDHALGPLRANFVVIDEPYIRAFDGNSKNSIELIMIPFEPGHGREWLPKRVNDLVRGDNKNGIRILCIHLGIMDGNTPPWLRGSEDAIGTGDLIDIADKNGIDLVFAGNWHNHQTWELEKSNGDAFDIYQVGTLCPTGWDNPGTEGYGKLVMYDTVNDEITVKEIPGPRFIKTYSASGLGQGITDLNVEKAKACQAAGNDVYLRYTTQPDRIAETKAILDTMGFTAVEVMADDAEVMEKTRNAARAARKAEDLAQALHVWVKEMPLDEDVERNNVLNRCKGYLNV